MPPTQRERPPSGPDIQDIIATLQLLMGDLPTATRVTIIRAAFEDIYTISKSEPRFATVRSLLKSSIALSQSISDVVRDDQGIGKLAVAQIRMFNDELCGKLPAAERLMK
jgi:hypothetical protein